MADSDFSAIAEVVPQVSYEIVGRIIPGMIVLFSLFAAATGPTQVVTYLDEAVVHPDPALSGWAVLLAVLAAYMLSFTLDGVWQIPAIFRRRSPKPCRSDIQAPSKSLKFDVVNQKLPKAGSWLTKLYAEANATQVLIIGWVVSAVINLYCLTTAYSFERLWLEVGLGIGIIGAAAVRISIANTREESLENLWVLSQERAFTEQAEKTAGEGSSS